MDTPTSPPAAWSTPKFLAIAFVVEFAAMFATNGIFNVILGWNLPSWAIGIPATVLLLVLLPRWRVFRERMQPRADR